MNNIKTDGRDLRYKKKTVNRQNEEINRFKFEISVRHGSKPLGEMPKYCYKRKVSLNNFTLQFVCLLSKEAFYNVIERRQTTGSVLLCKWVLKNFILSRTTTMSCQPNNGKMVLRNGHVEDAEAIRVEATGGGFSIGIFSNYR